MPTSYLATNLVLPLPRASIEAALDEPVGRTSGPLLALVDAACLPLLHPDPDSLQHHADAAWLGAHVEWIAALSGWDLVVLLDALAGPACREERMQPWGWHRHASSVACIAFAYADAALAERLSSRLPADGVALFELMPAGDKDSVSVLLTRGGVRAMRRGYFPYQHHPIRQWLGSLMSGIDDAPPWPALEARRADEARQGSPLLTAWRAFMQRQRREALGRASADAQRLWHGSDRLPGDDPAALAPLAIDRRFMTDGRHVYFDGRLLDGIDARAARAVPGSDWPDGFVHENLFVVGYGGAWRNTVDGATFRALGHRHYVDAVGVYELHEGELIVREGFDPASIRLLAHDDDIYLADAARVALVRGNGLAVRPLKRVDAAAFRGVALLPFVTDGKRVWMQTRPCPALDAATLRAAPVSIAATNEGGWQDDASRHRHYAISGDAVFNVASESFLALADADATTFERLGRSMARDAHRVWCSGEPVAGARAAGFAWIDAAGRRWTDGVDVYDDDTRLSSERAAIRTVDVPLSRGRVERVGDGFRFEGAAVDGWHVDTHRVGALGCVEDASCFYSLSNGEGGSVLAWTRGYEDHPLLHYELDVTAECWRPAGPMPSIEQLRRMPTGQLLTGEELDTLLDCLPRGEAFEWTQSTYEVPAVVLRRWRDSRTLELLGSVRYHVMMWLDEAPTETIRPMRTPGLCVAIRDAFDTILDTASPVSEETLHRALSRLDGGRTTQTFAVDIDGGRASVLLEGGPDRPDGMSIEWKAGREVLHVGVRIGEGGFLAAEFLSRPASIWSAWSGKGFSAARSTAEVRAGVRRCVQAFLDRVPAAAAPRDLERHDTAAFVASAWCRDTLPGLVAMLAPRIDESEASRLVSRVRAAVAAAAKDESESAEDAAWEALLDGLEEHDLLVTFDKQDLVQAVALCQTMASAAGLAGAYALSDRAPGDSFLDIAIDFERWLEPAGWRLLWPRASLRSSGDDHFPAVIVGTGSVGDVVLAAEALGGSRTFDATWSG